MKIGRDLETVKKMLSFYTPWLKTVQAVFSGVLLLYTTARTVPLGCPTSGSLPVTVGQQAHFLVHLNSIFRLIKAHCCGLFKFNSEVQFVRKFVSMKSI